MAVGWAVVRSLAGFPDAEPSGGDYLGGGCLPSLGRRVVGALGYGDKHALSLCGLERIDVGVLLISAGDGKGATAHEGPRERQD